MSRIDKDPSVFHEPCHGEAGSRDTVSGEPALGGTLPPASAEELAEHNVWDEPVMRLGDTAVPEGAPTYARWYAEGLAATSTGFTWLVTLGLCAVGGFFSIGGALFATPNPLLGGWLLVVYFGPVAEEMLKVGAPLIVLERRPFFFSNVPQIFLVVFASAHGFAIIENLMYLGFYIDAPSAAIREWRWTVCTAMHLSASCIGALGLSRMMLHSRRDLSKPRLVIAAPYLMAAAILHGTYNLFALGYEGLFDPF